MSYLRQLADGSLLLSLHVQPRARKNEITGIHDKAIKLRLTAPPVDGRANKAVRAFIAEKLGIPRASVMIKSGNKSREKQILLHDCDETAVRDTIESWFHPQGTEEKP